MTRSAIWIIGGAVLCVVGVVMLMTRLDQELREVSVTGDSSLELAVIKINGRALAVDSSRDTLRKAVVHKGEGYAWHWRGAAVGDTLFRPGEVMVKVWFREHVPNGELTVETEEFPTLRVMLWGARGGNVFVSPKHEYIVFWESSD